MLFLWFYHACRRGYPRFMMVTDHMNALTFEDPASVNLVRRALKLAQAGDLYGAAETANVDVGHAQVVSEGLRRGMRYSIGAEVDNDPRARPDAQNIVEAMRPDGLIRSVHFIPIDHPVHGPNWNWPFDNPEFASLYDHVGTEKTWELYMSVLLDALERLPGHIVGHFYVPAIFGNWPDQATLEGYEDKLLDICEQKGLAVEFNTRFLYRDHTDDEKRRYLDANRRLLRKAKERGVGIAVGSDAHSPRDQGNSFVTVLGVLDELEINEIVFPITGRLLRVALRYVKPPEPEPAPPPPPPPVPEPVPVAAAQPAPIAAAAAELPEAKPVRKARPAASSARPKEAAPERTEPTPAEAPVPLEPVPVPKPARAKAKAAAPEVTAEPVVPEPPAAAESKAASETKAAPAAAKAPAKQAPAKPVTPVKAAAPTKASAPPVKAPVVKLRAPVKPAVKTASKPAALKATAPKPAAPKAAAPAKPPAKAASAKAAPSKKAALPKKPPAKHVAPKKAAPAKKAAPVKKAGAKKAAPKKAVPAKKTAPKKAVPAKKAAPKKSVPVKKAAPVKKAIPAKKASKPKAPVKKSSAKKPAAKRR